MGIVDIEFNRRKKLLYLFLSFESAVDVAFYFVVLDGSRNRNFIELGVARWRELFVGVVKLKCDRGFGD